MIKKIEKKEQVIVLTNCENQYILKQYSIPFQIINLVMRSESGEILSWKEWGKSIQGAANELAKTISNFENVNDIVCNNFLATVSECVAEKFKCKMTKYKLYPDLKSQQSDLKQYACDDLVPENLDEMMDGIHLLRMLLKLPKVTTSELITRVSGQSTVYAYDQVFGGVGHLVACQDTKYENKALDDFLNTKKEKPIYIGFGSMPIDTVKLYSILLQISQETGQAFVFCTGWSSFQGKCIEIKSNLIFVVDFIPHFYILPRCWFAIHHGGSGTVHACLDANIHQVICPIIADQFYWAHVIQEMNKGSWIKEITQSEILFQISKRLKSV